jgi:hypothetical protein
MCFSASASFSAGVVLTAIGVASIKKTHHRSQLLFASIPLIFGVQQVAEGILWLTLPNPDYVNTQKIFTYIFLVFAQIIWPIWVPIAILMLEKSSTRKNTQKILVGAGLLVGVYLTYCLLTYNVQAKIVGYHISYIQEYPLSFRTFFSVLYILATIATPFFSHMKRMWMLGSTILISYIVTTIFYDYYIVSVWCFFSSIMSLFIYAIMLDLYKAQKPKPLNSAS